MLPYFARIATTAPQAAARHPHNGTDVGVPLRSDTPRWMRTGKRNANAFMPRRHAARPRLRIAIFPPDAHCPLQTQPSAVTL